MSRLHKYGTKNCLSDTARAIKFVIRITFNFVLTTDGKKFSPLRKGVSLNPNFIVRTTFVHCLTDAMSRILRKRLILNLFLITDIVKTSNELKRTPQQSSSSCVQLLVILMKYNTSTAISEHSSCNKISTLKRQTKD